MLECVLLIQQKIEAFYSAYKMTLTHHWPIKMYTGLPLVIQSVQCPIIGHLYCMMSFLKGYVNSFQKTQKDICTKLFVLVIQLLRLPQLLAQLLLNFPDASDMLSVTLLNTKSCKCRKASLVTMHYLAKKQLISYYFIIYLTRMTKLLLQKIINKINIWSSKLFNKLF